MNNPHTNYNDQPAKSLYQVVESNIRKYLSAATRNSNSFINNVSEKLRVDVNENILNSVLGGVLHAVIAHVRNSHIHISAKELYGRMIEVNVKDDNCYNTYAVALSLQDVVPLAEQIGAHIDISNQKQRITTVSVRFPINAATG